MEKLSGLVLDVFDDPAGEVLKGIFPTYDDVPEVIKTAMPTDSVQLSQLPDDVFALVLHDDDNVVLRKYACIDEGNTCLHVEYFLKTAGKLPIEAQQVAAENLLTACGWYNIDPPEELQKIAVSREKIVGAVAGAKGPNRLAKFHEGLSKIRGRTPEGVSGKVETADDAAAVMSSLMQGKSTKGLDPTGGTAHELGKAFDARKAAG
jgi:hypothetical protein